ncbi:MAG: ParA family protein [Synergistaceae bacterium]|nr:ParA family protein [Synergistaceae bacterium]
MKVIAIANQKGGIGKTTTAAALSAGLKQRGFKVLAVDVDPQGNLSTSTGANNYEMPTVYEMLKGEVDANEAIQKLDVFDIIPSNVMLAGAEQELSQIGKEQRLKERLLPIMDFYDYIVIDTPPALGVLTINAFTVADEIIIPTTAGIFAATGIKQLHDTIINVRKYCNEKVKIAGILLTRYDPRANNNKDMKDLTEQLGEYINAKLFNTHIRASIVVEESQARQIDVFSYKGKSTVAQDYTAWIDEYLKGVCS